MKRVSYAQNGEDIVLWRAFAGQDTGYYIDVGAADPRADSVTKLFYDHGWRGINIEPQLQHWRDLERDRPGDVNLHCGLGAEASRRPFVHNRDIPGWSTFSDRMRAKYEAADMNVEVSELEVRTLADVWDEYAPPVVDFLKIDVEGFEREVVLGGDWRRHRPRVIVIEATEPESWESIFAAARYHESLFDGVNRFYVRDEDSDLIPVLTAPANVLDQYLCWIDADHIRGLEKRLAELDAEVARLRGTTLPAPGGPSSSEWFRGRFADAAEQVIGFLGGDGIALGGKQVADIGSGDGIIDLGIALHAKPARLVGFDVIKTEEERLLELGRREQVLRELPRTLEFRRSEVTQLPADDDSFDVAFSWSTFGQVAEPVPLLREIHRVLRPHGVLMIQVSPLYHSKHGSHLWEYFPEGFAHLTRDNAEIEAEVRDAPGPDPERAVRQLEEFRSCNRLTLDGLHSALEVAGFRVGKLELLTEPIHIPPILATYPLSLVGVSGVKLLAGVRLMPTLAS